MANVNPSNFGTLIGRVAGEIQGIPNSKGMTVLFSLIAKDNFKSTGDDGEKSVQSEAIPLKAFVPANRTSKGWHQMIHTGDKIEVMTYLTNDKFVDKAGETQYKLNVNVSDVSLLESKATVDARAAKRASEGKTTGIVIKGATQPAAAPAAPAQVPGYGYPAFGYPAVPGMVPGYGVPGYGVPQQG